jgi:Lrp/AsnC family transcriptional regulator for asnA, asnC and gidA
VRKKLIKKFTIEIDDSLLGMSVKASVGINRDPKFKTQIHKKLLEVSEVISISEVTGRFDIIIQVYTQDLEDLHTVVIEKIGKIEGIQNTETFVELQKTDKEPVYLTKNV